MINNKTNIFDQRRKRVLVLGGAGFIGTHLCRRLLVEGKEVICVDNFTTGQISNVEVLLTKDLFEFIEHDIINPFNIEGNIDEIYNLACPASPVQYQKDPIKTFKTSVIGSMNSLELARKKNCRILLASTSEVYGDPKENPQSESYFGNVNPNGPRSCYDEGKRGAETLFCDYNRIYGVDTRIVRIFNTYGPLMREDDGRVVSTFIMHALKDKPLNINGDGSQTRSFLYIDDLVEALVRMMNYKDCKASIVNVGNTDEISINSLSKIILSLTNYSSKITYDTLPENDPLKRRPDITRAIMLLGGWHPKVSLNNGLTRTIEYFKTLI